MISDALSIEEYLAGEQYQLGEPRGIYRRSVTFSGQVALLALMMLVLTLITMVLLLVIEGLGGLSVTIPSLGVAQFMIALARVLALVRHEAVVMPFFREISVSVYREGLLYRRGSRARAVHWENITAVRRAWQIERSRGKLKRVTTAYVCSVQAQPVLTLDVGIDRVAELGKLIEQEVIRRQLPGYQEKIQAGETVTFEKLSLSAHAIQYGTQSRNWLRLREIEIGPDRLVLQDIRDVANTFTIPLTSLPNVCLVEELLTWLRAGADVHRDMGRTRTAEGPALLCLGRSEEQVATGENHLGDSSGASVHRHGRIHHGSPGEHHYLPKRAA